MTENNTPNQRADDEIDLRELFSAIWQGKWIIIVTTFVFAVAGVFYALSLPNIYQASVKLASASNGGNNGVNKIAGQLGGLASLAGINIGGNTNDQSSLALEVLKSRQFIETFIEKHDLLVPLMAAESWVASTGKLIIDRNIYDINTNKWLPKDGEKNTQKPTDWQAYIEFKKLLIIKRDAETDIITIIIEHMSPATAKEWVAQIVTDINSTMKEKDKQDASKNIEFLTQQLQKTKLSDMRSVFYQLIEEQTKTIMLAEVSDEYVFKIIDPANVPDEKSRPKRLIIVIAACTLGFLLGLFISVFRYFYKLKK